MKSLAIALLMVIAFCAGAAMSPRPVSAQAANGNIVLLNVGPPSSCVWPANVTAGMVLCATTSGLYYSLGPTALFNPVAPTSTGGVTSFNGRTGAVTLTKADVTATGLAATTSASTTLQ